MPLLPVDESTPLALRDADAAAPSGIPVGAERRAALRNLTDALGKLQRVLHADGRYALLVVLQGRDASGKDGAIRKVFRGVGPQGCDVTSFGPPTEYERRHDFLWRVHQRVPARGTIGVFNRSQYEDVLVPRARDLEPRALWAPRYEQINAFEAILAANRVVILKFFLHISRAEQLRRFGARRRDPRKAWKDRAVDREDRRAWNAYSAAYRELLRRCSTPWAPWYIVPADDKRARDWLLATTIVRTLEQLSLRYPPPAGTAQRTRR